MLGLDLNYTVEHVLLSFIKGQAFILCFYWFKKKFDSVDGQKLWLKLSQVGIQGKLLKTIQSMDLWFKRWLKWNFCNKIGLIQREVLSPILFNVYVNDFMNDWHIGEHFLEIVDQFTYLGIIFYSNNKFTKAESGCLNKVRKQCLHLKEISEICV